MESKKASIILIYKVLEEYSDSEHFLTQQEIIDLIEKHYNVKFERKSVAFSLDILIDLDYGIIKSKKGGYALVKRTFSREDANIIIDSVISNKNVNDVKAKKITKKVNSLLSKYERDEHKELIKSPYLNVNPNPNLFKYISIIEEAIRKNKKIGFSYYEYDKEVVLSLKKNGQEYVVSPYYLINNYGSYFLISNYSKKRPLQIFKVEKMFNVNIKEEPLKEIKDIDLKEFVNNHIYLLGGDFISAEIIITNDKIIDKLYDEFGPSAFIYNKDDILYARIRANETAIINFLLLNGSSLKVIGPTLLKEKLSIKAKEISKLFK